MQSFQFDESVRFNPSVLEAAVSIHLLEAAVSIHLAIFISCIDLVFALQFFALDNFEILYGVYH